MSKPWVETIFTNRADFTAVASTSSEASLLAGLNLQPALPFPFFGPNDFGKGIRIKAQGIFSTTGTPTIIFQARLSPTVGSATLSGASVGVSAAITTINNSANSHWALELTLVCNTPGYSTNNTTLSGAGTVKSANGFAAPYEYALEPTTPNTATWTQTIDAAVTNYLNLSVTWSAASASNTITCKQLSVERLN